MSLQLGDSPAIRRFNSVYLGRACELAYEPDSTGGPKFRSELGLTTRLFSEDNTQVYVGGDAQNIVIAFRGSQSPTSMDGIKDWLLTNADNFLIQPSGEIGIDFAAAGVGARFHRGFMRALHEIWQPAITEIQRLHSEKERPIWVTGHSLGGALAILAAWRMQQNFIPIHQVVTFGSPMVGNDVAMAAFEREFAGRILRYVDQPDVVPWLPTLSLVANPFVHCPNEVRLGTGSGPQSAVDVIRDLATGLVDSLLQGQKFQEQLEALVAQRLKAHDIANYIRLVSGQS